MTASAVISLVLLLLGQPSAQDAPQGHGIAWHNIGPGGGGWIESIAYDPRDAGTIYVGCDVGGFYVSRDGGRSFQIHNDGLRDYFIQCIAVHPRDPSVILLGAEGGIYKSTDGGSSWQWKRRGFPEPRRYEFSAPIGALAFDPSDPRVVYCGIGRPRFEKEGQGIIYKSTDTGESWTRVSAGRLPADAFVSGLAVKPDDGQVVLAATSRGVFRTDDAGASWRNCSDGLPHDATQGVVFAPSSPSVAYVSMVTTARDDQPWNGGVYRSDDAGITWKARCDGLTTYVGRSAQVEYNTSGVGPLAVDPRNADVIYAGDTSWVSAGVMKTTDGGLHWERASYHWGDRDNMDLGWCEFGPAATCLAISPADPARVILGTSGMVIETRNAGATWEQRYSESLPGGRFKGNGLEVTCVFDVVFDPVRPRRLYLAYFDIGLLISDDLGHSFRRSFQGMKYSSNCFAVVVDPDSPDTLWAGTGWWATNEGGVCRSDDGAKTWRDAGTPDAGLPDGQTQCLVLDRSSPVGRRRLLVTSQGHGLYQTLDGGATWASINGDLPQTAAEGAWRVLIDPANPQRLRLAARGSPAKGAGVYETTDGGRQWRRVNRSDELADIYGLVADPKDFDTLYLCQRELYDREVEPNVTRPGGVFRSTDGGRTWERLLSYHFVQAIAVSPADSRTLYAATMDHAYHDDSIAEGILKSTDGGNTWAHENDGMSLRQVTCIGIDPHDPSVLCVGTGGNSAFIGRDRKVVDRGKS